MVGNLQVDWLIENESTKSAKNKNTKQRGFSHKIIFISTEVGAGGRASRSVGEWTATY